MAFLLAGQGAYRPGLFASEASNQEISQVLATVDAVAAEFGRSGVRTWLFDPQGPAAADLARTDPFGLQLAVFGAAVGEYYRAARAGTPDVVVGHSLGELAALAVAGCFDLADAARLVGHRSVALANAALEPGGMLSLDLSERRAAHLVGAVGDRRVAVAVVNAPSRTVVSGPDVVLDAVRRVADALGVRTVRLPAPYAFHSPGLALAAQAFAESAAAFRRRPARLPVYSPVLGDYVSDTADLVGLLVRHLTTPVDFLGAVRALHAEGLRSVVECGRSGLAALVQASVPDVVSAGDSVPEPVAPAAPGQTEPPLTAVPQTPAPQPAVPHTTVPLPQTAVPPARIAPAAAAPNAGTVTDRLRELYATTLGYPLEAVEADADLEADLGIDSLKRAEMLGKVGAMFDLPGSVNDGRFLAHTTLAELAGMIAASLQSVGVER